ncbi:hypothetical protein [Agromyces sp. NPDC058104]|uniref:hypothetical protein n=1 Tax=Agromyces sp. NPDC058104 TaxID=3346342 RepID=UPI0036D96673
MTGSAIVAYIRARSGAILTWAIVAATFLITYVTFIRWYRFFFPDSRYYLAMAYLFGGADPETARDLTVDFADPRGIPVPPVDDLFGWGLVQPRVVYPVLSVPFVKLFGAYGLAVVPLLAAVALTILLTLILMRRYGNVVAVATMLLVNGSLFLMSFHTGMLTESLSGLFAVLALLAAWRWLERPSPWLLVAMGAATAASAFTRQATLIMAGAFVMAWLLGSLVGRRNSPWMWPAIVVGGTAVGCQVLQSLVFPSFSQLDQFLKQAGAETLGEAILRVPAMLLHILASDAAAMMRADRTLLFLIGLAVASMILFWRRTESHLLLGAILGIALYNVTNGTPTQFRYATPGLVFYVLAAAVIIAHTADRVTKAIADRRNRSMAEGTTDPAAPSAASAAEPAG